MFALRVFALVALALTGSGCSNGIIPGAPQQGAAPPPSVRPSADTAARPVPATPAPSLPNAAVVTGAATARAAGLVRGLAVERLGLGDERAAAALAAFRTSCPGLLRRTDGSGLTNGEDWREPCEAAARAGNARAFFAEQFDTVQIGDGKTFVTGYFEPEIAGVRSRRAGFEVPVYGRPSDLIDVDLGQFSDDLKGRSVRGKVEGTKLVLYDDRAAIDGGSLGGRAPVIAWAADPIELFFLQVQGSGRLRAPDGSIMRIGYASQNGRDYVGIGKLLRDRGLIGPGEASMQGIVAWLRRNPEQGRRVMQENKSFVFFRELTGPGPLGAMGYPVTGETSLAADPKFVPLGAPVWLSLDRAEPNGLWVVQDTGGAIKGANRFDSFWGAGDRARAIAGGMSARGSALILLPKASVRRLGL